MPINEPLLLTGSLGYSLRRYFVDRFHFHHVPRIPTGSQVLDLGGNKIRKRGQFNIECYAFRVVYANLSPIKKPDVQADASKLPFKNNSFDAVICSELLEHVPNLPLVLYEVYRVLRTGGKVLICAPFLYRIHGDPYDYGRYTDHYWQENLAKVGFVNIEIEKQGLFWSVLVDMLREMVYQKMIEGWLRSGWIRSQIARLINWARKAALKWETGSDLLHHPFFGSFTTGFGIVASKLNIECPSYEDIP